MNDSTHRRDTLDPLIWAPEVRNKIEQTLLKLPDKPYDALLDEYGIERLLSDRNRDAQIEWMVVNITPTSLIRHIKAVLHYW